MNLKINKRVGAGGAAASVLLVGAAIFNAIPAAAVDFASPAFQRTWDRTDSLVASGQVSRTWFWGPEPRAAAQEQYVDAPNGTGTRLVQYFDKSRMEINNPNADQNTPFYVTNGLLTVELITGQMQIGNNAFINRYPAEIPISGDTDDTNAPTYAIFLAYPTPAGATTRSQPHGQFATATINKAGQVGDDPSKASVPGTRSPTSSPPPSTTSRQLLGLPQRHRPDQPDGPDRQRPPDRPLVLRLGLPISEPYWAKVKIAGREHGRDDPGVSSAACSPTCPPRSGLPGARWATSASTTTTGATRTRASRWARRA